MKNHPVDLWIQVNFVKERSFVDRSLEVQDIQRQSNGDEGRGLLQSDGTKVCQIC